MAERTPVIWWVRRDLRLADNPVLEAAVLNGRPVVPVFILDKAEEALGAAPKFRLGLGLEHFGKTLKDKGSRLILRRGDALEVLRGLAGETGAGAVFWSRLYDPEAIKRDSAVKSALKDEGIDACSFAGRLLFEPWTVETGQGGMYKVYTPFWKAVRDREPAALIPEPGKLPAPESWPESDALEDWKMPAAMRRGADVVRKHCRVGEAKALDRLESFLDGAVQDYKAKRNFPALDAVSGLSENLAWGEISPHRIWHGGIKARQEGKAGAEHFVKELVWREFSYHLMYHSPQLLDANWREGWDDFPWSAKGKGLDAWQRGRTGYGLVDAAMREMYVTGRMHNRARMIVASFLTKHLMVHWKTGQEWFADCLIDWDPAANAMGWQWVAGSGPDAAPFFRIFNPETQAEKFDPEAAYRRAWLAEGQKDPPQTALDFFEAAPKSWKMSPDMEPPEPVVGLEEGREQALEAYQSYVKT